MFAQAFDLKTLMVEGTPIRVADDVVVAPSAVAASAIGFPALLSACRPNSAPSPQELLAAMAGSRREVVGRALKALSQEGAIKLERGRIHVCDRAALERLAWM